MKILTRLTLPIIVMTLALSGCGSSTTKSSGDHHGSDKLMISNAWVADKSPMDPTMTAAFGTLMNHSDKTITVTAGSTEVAGKVEIHEVVSDGAGGMKMQPKPGGLKIKSGGEAKLEPGHDHIMLMMLKRELKPGEKVKITLSLSDGSTMDFEAPVKPFKGADEKYDSGN